MATTTYPYWDSDNRYIVQGQEHAVGGLSSKPVVFAQIYQLPNSWWQVRCYGNRSDCPEKLGPYFGPLANAQDAIEAHCQSVHYVTPPAVVAAALSTAPADPCTPSKIVPRF